MIKAILACDSLGGIAKNGTMPWPKNIKDLNHFKTLTAGSTVVMGRRTWESSDMPSPLPGRRNVVVTRDEEYDAQGAEILSDGLKASLTNLAKNSTIYVIGGAEIFKLLIDEIQVLHLSRIAGQYDCDTFLPMDEIYERFEKIDTVDIDKMTRFETYLARKLNDLPI